MLESVNKIASFVGADRRTVQLRADQMGLVAQEGEKGAKLYDSRTLAQLVPAPSAPTDSDGVLPTLEQARTENTVADTKLKNLQAAKLEGVLADVTEIVEEQQALFEDMAAIIKKSNLGDTEKEDILNSIVEATRRWAKGQDSE